MKYFLCVLAVIVEYIVYAMIGVALGWKHGGGVLPLFVLYAAMAATCRAIVKYFNGKKKYSTSINDNQEDEDGTK